tara:strand:+ start:12623 stop:12868 length:246 start_codon:yes stop_codon:yes gene_type:complete
MSSKGTSSTGGGKSTSMTQSDASRVQSSQVSFGFMFASSIVDIALKARGGGDMSSSGFASRAQSAGDRNANTSGQSKGGSK